MKLWLCVLALAACGHDDHGNGGGGGNPDGGGSGDGGSGSNGSGADGDVCKADGFHALAWPVTAAQPNGLVIGDFDRDGTPDLAVSTPSNGISVMLGKGHGAYHARLDYATNYTATAIAAGDFDGDGKLDLAVATNGGVA